MRYFVQKKEYNTKNVEHLDIVFQNGNYLRIGKDELSDLRLSMYDRLIRYGDSASFVGHSGYVKLKISPRKSIARAGSFFLYNPETYRKDRKVYIETRCTDENDIDHLILYNENNWNDMIFGDIRCHREGKFLILQFEPNPKYGLACSDEAYIDLPAVEKKDILKINLDFENCDFVTVYEPELREIDLKFDEQLAWCGGDYCRSVRSGVLRLKLLCDFQSRNASLYDPEHQGATVGKMIERLCGTGEDVHDIGHLYITYGYAGYGHLLKEKIEVADMCLYEEEPGDEKTGEQSDDGGDCFYIGGCAKTERDGSVTVRFGACCADDVRSIAKKKKYPVKIRTIPCSLEGTIAE